MATIPKVNVFEIVNAIDDRKKLRTYFYILILTGRGATPTDLAGEAAGKDSTLANIRQYTFKTKLIRKSHRLSWHKEITHEVEV